MSDELVQESLSEGAELTTDSVHERAERQLEEGLERLREAVRRAQDTLRKTEAGQAGSGQPQAS